MLAPSRETREETGRRPASLCLKQVTAPGGRIIDASAFFYSGEPCLPLVAFEVVDPQTFTVQPGRYHVELEGVAVVAEGPWQLSGDVRAP